MCVISVCVKMRDFSGDTPEKKYIFSKSFLATVLVSAFLYGKTLIHPEDIQTITRI